MDHPTVYRTTRVDGVTIFYREAGPKDAPTILLLHGPALFVAHVRASLRALSERYHLVAPDYLGLVTAMRRTRSHVLVHVPDYRRRL